MSLKAIFMLYSMLKWVERPYFYWRQRESSVLEWFRRPYFYYRHSKSSVLEWVRRPYLCCTGRSDLCVHVDLVVLTRVFGFFRTRATVTGPPVYDSLQTPPTPSSYPVAGTKWSRWVCYLSSSEDIDRCLCRMSQKSNIANYIEKCHRSQK